MISYFSYNGISSEDYGLIIAFSDTEPNKKLGGNFEYITYQNNHAPNNVIQDINYNTSFEYEVEFFSTKCRLDDRIVEIYDWLFNQRKYLKFKYDYWDDMYMNCVFTNPEKITVYSEEGWGIYGIKATLKADSEFLWEDIKETYTDRDFNLNCDSFVRNYIYPDTVEIKIGSEGGTILIQNISDNNRITRIDNILPNDTITFTAVPRRVVSYLNDNQLLTYDNFNKKFPRLIPKVNHIGIEGDFKEITIEYKRACTFANDALKDFTVRCLEECVHEYGFATTEQILALFKDWKVKE